MSELIRLSVVLHSLFATDQYSHIRQQPDGNYFKINKPLTSSLIKSCIEENGALGAYQKNIDSTVCWICFDFDVKKKYLDSTAFDDCMAALHRVIDGFCEGLVLLDIPYLLEYSGNRGMHVWIFFKERIAYRTAYEIADNIKQKLLREFESDFLALDMFPKSKVNSAGVGFGVKLPVSKHAKSSRYSLALEERSKSSSAVQLMELDERILGNQADILERIGRISKAELEKRLGGFFEMSRDYSFAPHRIKSITVDKNVTVEDLFLHWESVVPLADFEKKVCSERKLNHSERMLLVGLLINIKSEVNSNLGFDLLIEIFSRAENFNLELTKKAIESLRSYHFPSQLQIETVLNSKFGVVLSLEELLELCSPSLVSFENGSFELSSDDVEVARSAELKYIFQNDEVYCHKVINEITSIDNQKLLADANALSKKTDSIITYVHERHEETKIRRLVTLGGVERIFTSAVLNQIDYFFKFNPSINSFGYQLNSGFKDGYIFKPWLYLWVEFISNIGSALEDSSNKDFYVVKVDISSYYDSISHEQLKRLMLGGVNKKLDEKIDQLSPLEFDKYKVLIEKLFRFTSNFSVGGVGLPQGPAYARYMAELYLDNIDTVFDNLLSAGELLFYHRYVDDIFFISKTESSADEHLALLKSLIENLGLRVNDSKTKKSKISNFAMDFQQYRAQSKYAVDRATRGDTDITNAQKNLAINEFMTLVQADTCEDDLAFIFSHLNDISELDDVKFAMVLPALASGNGRGSLFKHIFCFVIDESKRWTSLLEIKNFNILQSEVLTSTMLSHLANLPVGDSLVFRFFEELLEKLSISPLVQEHLVLLKVLYGLNVELEEIPPSIIAAVIGSCPDPARLHIDSIIVRHLTTLLAAEQNLARFVELIFPLCISANTPAPELNKLAEVFYAKLANDSRLGSLSLKDNPEFSNEVLAVKYYHLLCIFSLADTSSDLPLLKAMWEMCINVFNELKSPLRLAGSDNWFAKLSHVSIHHPKSSVVMAAILDGSICRGVTDHKAVFESYHNMVMIFVSSRMEEIMPIYDVANKLEALKERGIFYRWLLDNDGASHFPSQQWFEHNAFENNCIMLRRGREVLIRKSNQGVFQSSGAIVQNGYAEKVQSYAASDYRSIKDALSGLSFLEFVETIVAVISRAAESGEFPNIFSEARIVTSVGVSPFTEELSNLPSIIFERSDGVSIYRAEMDNFINCIFSVDVRGELRSLVEGFRDNYLNVLGSDVKRYQFLRSFRTQLQQMPNPSSKLSIDIAAAASVFLELKDLEGLRRIEKFFECYNKFNRDGDFKCVFCVDSSDVIDDSNPNVMLKSLKNSFDKIGLEISSTLAFNISQDFCLLLDRLENSLGDNSLLGFSLTFDEFSKSRVDVRHAERLVGSGQDEYSFDAVYLVHSVAGGIQSFDVLKHSFLVQASSHVYVAKRGAKLVLMPMSVVIGKMYNILLNQKKSLLESGASSNYPKGMVVVDPLEYRECDKAVRVVSEHIGIGIAEAENILGKWLRGIPAKFRQAVCSLIAGHIVMKEVELDRFVSKVEELLSCSGGSAFFIKELSDFNGTQRVLLRNQQLVRYVDAHGPLSIPVDAEEATLIVDNVITGGQIISALKYYVLNKGLHQNYYRYTAGERKEVSARLKGLKKLNVLQVFHTDLGIEAIRQFCIKNLNPDILVEVIDGRDIGGDAFFGSTKALSQKDKELIREVLSEGDSVGELYNNLKGDIDQNLQKDLDKINMVARYRSLPKKCFSFLHLGLIFDPQCAPFERVKEKYERQKSN